MIRLLISESSILLKSKLNNYTNDVLESKNEFNYCVFDFEETSLDDIITTLESPSFFGEKKVIVCKNPYFFKDEKMKLPFENNLEQFLKYLSNPNPDNDLIVVCPEKYYNNKNKYFNALSKVSEVENLLFEDEKDFTNYANMLLKGTKISLDNDAKNLLINRCLGDVCKLEREIAKLSLYPEKIDVDIINKMVAKPLEDDVFELSNAILKKDHKQIMQIYNDLKLLKIEPINLISLLANQFRLMLQVSILKNQNLTDNEIATTLNVHPYRIKLAKQYIQQNYSLNTIKNILLDLSDLDYKIKIGEYDRYVDFELFLATK